jgi:hypothetical protein
MVPGTASPPTMRPWEQAGLPPGDSCLFCQNSAVPSIFHPSTDTQDATLDRETWSYRDCLCPNKSGFNEEFFMIPSWTDHVTELQCQRTERCSEARRTSQQTNNQEAESWNGGWIQEKQCETEL